LYDIILVQRYDNTVVTVASIYHPALPLSQVDCGTGPARTTI